MELVAQRTVTMCYLYEAAVFSLISPPTEYGCASLRQRLPERSHIWAIYEWMRHVR
jgi:hypothetical protein